MTDILTSLGVDAKTPMFEVWNKLDLVEPSARDSLTVQRENRSGVFPVSALTGEGVDDLLSAISEAFAEVRLDETLALPFAMGRTRARLHAMGVVVSEDQDDTGYKITVRWTTRQKAQWQAD